MWLIWMYDMCIQLFPYIKSLPIGSKKHFLEHFRPSEVLNPRKLLAFVRQCGADARRVGIAWGSLTALIGVLYFTGIVTRNVIFVISMFFYLSDVICVLFWCPFRAFLMHNRCCTTCRIYNWDHMMMFSPFLFVPGFYTWSLLALGIVIMVIWEIKFAQHPERFWEGSNKALRCSQCTDRLCKNRLCAPDYSEVPDGDPEAETQNG